MRINERVKELRVRDNMTQTELAEKLNCNRQKIADWERGKTTPAADDIILLAKIFYVTSDYLLGLVNNPSKDVRHIEMTELTGLDDGAIEELASNYLAGWREDNTLANKIMNTFVGLGLFEMIINKMARYCISYSDYINELNKIYKEAQDTYEQMGMRIVVTDEFKRLTSAADGSDSSANKRDMKLSLFEMAELPKDFTKSFFSYLESEKKEILSQIKELDIEIRAKNIKEITSMVEQAEQDIKEREAQKHGDNTET